jgi:hypothetical protein
MTWFATIAGHKLPDLCQVLIEVNSQQNMGEQSKQQPRYNQKLVQLPMNKEPRGNGSNK